MVEDIFISESKQTAYDAVGDWKTVRGRDAIAQAVTIAILETVDLSAPTFDAEEIESQRGSIERVVDTHPWTQSPVRVDVTERDTEKKRIEYRVVTPRVSLPVETI